MSTCDLTQCGHAAVGAIPFLFRSWLFDRQSRCHGIVTSSHVSHFSIGMALASEAAILVSSIVLDHRSVLVRPVIFLVKLFETCPYVRFRSSERSRADSQSSRCSFSPPSCCWDFSFGAWQTPESGPPDVSVSPPGAAFVHQLGDLENFKGFCTSVFCILSSSELELCSCITDV